MLTAGTAPETTTDLTDLKSRMPMLEVDWLSHLLAMIAVTGRLDVRRAYGAPWRVAMAPSAADDIAWHVVLEGRAIIEEAQTGTSRELTSGDIVLLLHGSAHVLHDGSGQTPSPTRVRRVPAGWDLSENDAPGQSLVMLSGRFFIAPPHDRVFLNYLPSRLVVRGVDHADEDDHGGRSSNRLANLVMLMGMESDGKRSGGYAILNALISALFTLVLRVASESGRSPAGLLALAGHAELAPAVAAMFADPARPWNVPELAALCGMSRATFMRRFQDKLGRSATELLADIRMSLAANALKKPAITTEAVADAIGYRSVAAFRRVFSDRMGMTPGRWRRLAGEKPG